MSETQRVSHRLPDVVRATGLGRTTIYNLIASGELRTFKVGRVVLVADEDLRDFVARRRTGERASA